MTEGAETRTPSNTPIMDAAMGWHDRRDLLSQIGTLEMDLTEALKVAGEATKPITFSDIRLHCGEGTLHARDVLTAVNAILLRREIALERIINKGQTPTGEENE